MAMHTNSRHLAGALPGRELTGGPRRPTRFERRENVRSAQISGSHMPLDTDIHWRLGNPLNIIPGLLLLVLAYGLIGTLVTLLV
jgi:hypothetical protein